jgi:CelD/BcsL family acetyltransferase involved in cellulose biosynthesis
VSDEPGEVCPWIDLRGLTWDDYLASCGAAHRYAFRRKLRRLEERFRIELRTARSEDERAEALDALFRLHEARWRGRGGSDGLGPAWVRRFHHAFTREALARGWLRLSVLTLDGRPAAALYGLMHGGVFWFYQSGLDPTFARQSVGLVTMGLTIRDAIAEGAVGFDMLHGEEEYKSHWARSRRRLTTARAYPPGLGGAWARRVHSAARLARRGARRLVAAARPA